ncbi:hypothetical protein [Sphingobium aquiterrae]|uniref:hypothetical protein n=1 Tax=Sphingobium aquiterrae TaxID=2038656 RepID=UPI003019A6B7
MLDMRPPEGSWGGGGGASRGEWPAGKPHFKPGDREWLLYTSGSIVLACLAFTAIRNVVSRRNH